MGFFDDPGRLPPVTGIASATYRGNAPSAMFYGGLAVYYADYTTTKISQPYVMYGTGGVPDPNQPDDRLWLRSQWVTGGNPDAYSDMAIFATWGAGSPQSALHGLFMWKKEDFLNGGADNQVSFEQGSSMSVAQTRLWNGIEEARFVVQDSTGFYISEFSFGGSETWRLDSRATVDYWSLDPTQGRWSVYNPSDSFTNGVYGIAFDGSLASFQYHDFTDVLSVGIYIGKTSLTNDQTVFVFDDFQVNAVVPEPATCGLAMGAFLLLAARRRKHARKA